MSRRERFDAENFALAGAVAFPDLYDEAGLGPEEFSREPIAEAWSAIPRVPHRTTEGRVPLAQLAFEAKVPRGELAEALAAGVYSAEQARHWWRKLHDLARREELSAALEKLAKAPRDGDDQTAELLAEVEALASRFADRHVEQELATLTDVASEWAEQRVAELESGRRRGVETGLESIDSWLGGLNPGELTTIVAGGGVGKSTFAWDLGRRCAERGATVLAFSCEMTRSQVGQREAHGAIARPISDTSIRPADLVEAARVVEERASEARFFLDFRSRVTAPQVLATARRLQHRAGLGLVIVDHLGHFDARKPKASEQEQIATAVAELKDLAKLLEVPFVVLTHFNRQGFIRASERVNDTSDNVVELSRNVDDRHAPTELRIGKARQTGQRGRRMLLEYHVAWQSFHELPEPGSYPRVARAAAADDSARNEVPF